MPDGEERPKLSNLVRGKLSFYLTVGQMPDIRWLVEYLVILELTGSLPTFKKHFEVAIL